MPRGATRTAVYLSLALALLVSAAAMAADEPEATDEADVVAADQSPPPTGKKANDQSSISIGGYAQFETLYDLQNPGFMFQPRRLRLAVTGKSRDHLDGKLQIGFDRWRFEVKDLYLTGYGGDIGLRAGQFKVPFSEEVLISSSKRLSLERPPVARRLWPGERDIGAALLYNHDSDHATSVALGVFSGNGPRRLDNNAAKDIVVRVRQGFDDANGFAFAGAQFGRFTDNNAVTTPRRYFGGGAMWHDDDKDWLLHGEGYFGESMGNPFCGSFLRAARSFDDGDHTVFAMIDHWDPNRNAAGDTEWGPSLGYIYQIGNDTKLTLEWTGRQDQATAGRDDIFGGRVQVLID